MKKLLSINPDTGAKTYFHATPDAFHVEQVQDVEGVVDAAKAAYNNINEKTHWGEWQRVASIPLSIYYDLKAKGIVDDQKAMKKWLNDRDNQAFRTRPGVV
jgi:hypothetical protein